MKTLEDATRDRYRLTESSAAVDGWCPEVDQAFKKKKKKVRLSSS